MSKKYNSRIEGVLLGYEDVKIKESVVVDDFDVVHATVQVCEFGNVFVKDHCYFIVKASFYIFKPMVGSCIEGTVSTKKTSAAIVLVYEFFQAVCPTPSAPQPSIGDLVKIKISSVAYIDGRPQLLASIVDGQSSSPTKRKVAAAGDSQKAKKAKPSSDEEAATENDFPSSPKPRQAPGQRLELPEGYEVIQKKTASKEYKEYQDANGKRYRSVVEIYRSLGREIPPAQPKKDKGRKKEKVSKEEMSVEVESVVKAWNVAEDGSMIKNKNKYYRGDDLKKLPRNERFFTSSKSSSKTAAKTNDKEDINVGAEDPVEEEDTAPSTPAKPLRADPDHTLDEGLAVTTKKPKKKKKKNKDPNTTL